MADQPMMADQPIVEATVMEEVIFRVRQYMHELTKSFKKLNQRQKTQVAYLKKDDSH